MASHLITEAQIPILESLDSNAAKKLKEMCRDIEESQRYYRTSKQAFFKAFKIVVEQISSDFRNLQQKFEEYIAYHENETEVVNAQNKLVFFRNECQVLNKLCTELKCENQQLKVKIKEIEQEVNNQKMILLKQATKNSQLQQLILFYKEKQEALNQQYKHPKNDSVKFHSLINKDANLRVPQLKLHHRYHTEIQENDHNSIITYSQKHQTINICKTSKPKPNLILLNRTTDDILETQTEKQNMKQFDQFYERSYKSRTKSQQQTMKIHENSETTQKTQEISSSLIKNIRVNPSYYQQNLTVSS
ncbi:unnamed protein product (macronuclear) [Paramecium tetraurelia]|uniref:Translin-associated factor X-interacting protein 1 N-terminal domain-containing protein n=1 Tax=Paramecium tetraurelia TaxID=5888 RepID=A0CQL7_PARTE|nr:uncharacterized protein GSPATT00009432001 [Paramecium tetraurelia]CAK73084.1 unnamed protein product [Paramecium tetraurelia]|eukprot:XP_001440481.1 hypothetical protein (macronuclear) [Paramecium tetraurelia strain d4-2]